MLNILIPMAGGGTAFKNAGYSFPKPLIDVGGKTMIEVVVENLSPSSEHKFIFVCLKEQFEKFDLYHIFQNASKNKFEVVQIYGQTEGAACTALAAMSYINNENELLIANSDQYIEGGIEEFLQDARKEASDGFIMTFSSSHPKWSYARVDGKNKVLEVAEKKVISDQATAGLYYFKKGSDFVNGAQSMIHKNIRYNNEFYICPVYNELILAGKNIFAMKIDKEKMHGLGTPEDLNKFTGYIKEKQLSL